MMHLLNACPIHIFNSALCFWSGNSFGSSQEVSQVRQSSEGHEMMRRGAGRRGGRSSQPGQQTTSVGEGEAAAWSSSSEAQGPSGSASAFFRPVRMTLRDQAREAKRRAKLDELSDIDNRMSLAKFRGDDLEWGSLMGQRAMLEESDSDSDAYDEDDTRESPGISNEHVCNCDHCPVKKAKISSRESKQLAKRQEIAQIDHDMTQAKLDGDEFTYYSKMGLRLLAEESDSESEEDKPHSSDEASDQIVRLEVPPSPPPIEFIQSAIDRPAPPTARQISYSLARSRVKVKRGATKGGALFRFAQPPPAAAPPHAQRRARHRRRRPY